MTATIKDIAHKCGVSPAVVSVVLRNKKSRTTCSKDTREKILKTAGELNYRPNRLAKAMVCGSPPIVALSLHVERSSPTMVNFYLHDIMPAAAFALNKLGLEMIFQPFDTHEEQMRRLRELIADRLIGGVISNFIPAYQAEVVEFLTNIGLPFVVLGDNVNPAVPSVGHDTGVLKEFLRRYADRKGLDESIQFMLDPVGINRPLILDGRDWRLCVEDDERYFQNNSKTLLVIPNVTTKNYLIDVKGVSTERILLAHDERLPVVSRPVLLLKSIHWERATMAAELVATWMREQTPPETRQLTIKTDDLRLRLVE